MKDQTPKKPIQQNRLSLAKQQAQIDAILKSLSPAQAFEAAKKASAAAPAVTKTSITKYVLYYLTGFIKRIPDSAIMVRLSPFLKRILGGGVVNTLSNLRKLFVYLHAFLGLSIAFDYIPWDLSLGIVGFLSAVYGLYSETFGKLLARLYEWVASLLFGAQATPVEEVKKSKWLPWNWTNPWSNKGPSGDELETIKKQIADAERAKYEAQLAQLNAERSNLLHSQQAKKNWLDHLRDGLSVWNPLNHAISTSPSWLWYGVGAIAAAGGTYLAYKVASNPWAVIGFLFPAVKTIAEAGVDAADSKTPPQASTSALSDNDATPRASDKGKAKADITLADNRTAPAQPVQTAVTAVVARSFNDLNNVVVEAATATAHGVVGVSKTAANYLNPLNYFLSADEVAARRADWIARDQFSLDSNNKAYYPYTTRDPFDSYWTKLTKVFFTETHALREEFHLRKTVLDSARASQQAQYDKLIGFVTDAHAPVGMAVGVSGTDTPLVTAKGHVDAAVIFEKLSTIEKGSLNNVWSNQVDVAPGVPFTPVADAIARSQTPIRELLGRLPGGEAELKMLEAQPWGSSGASPLQPHSQLAQDAMARLLSAQSVSSAPSSSTSPLLPAIEIAIAGAGGAEPPISPIKTPFLLALKLAEQTAKETVAAEAALTARVSEITDAEADVLFKGDSVTLSYVYDASTGAYALVSEPSSPAVAVAPLTQSDEGSVTACDTESQVVTPTQAHSPDVAAMIPLPESSSATPTQVAAMIPLPESSSVTPTQVHSPLAPSVAVAVVEALAGVYDSCIEDYYDYRDHYAKPDVTLEDAFEAFYADYVESLDDLSPNKFSEVNVEILKGLRLELRKVRGLIKIGDLGQANNLLLAFSAVIDNDALSHLKKTFDDFIWIISKEKS